MLKIFLLIGVLILWEKVQGAPCNCGLGSGVDVCNPVGCGVGVGGSSDGSGALVVRPQELPVIDLGTITRPRIICKQVGGELSINPLKPVGSLCSCGQTIVKPAVIPRPSCACCSSSGSSSGGSSSSSSSSSQSSSSNHVISQTGGGSISIQFPACGPPVINQPRPQVPQAPADAVSLDLAYRQKQQLKNDKAELKLLYGFQRIPADTPCTKKSSTFREGNIHLVNGQVLELPNYAPPEEEEVEEEYIEEEEPEAVEVLTPTFGDLGYRLANYDSGKFINVVNEQAETCNTGVEILPACNDGYRPGEVIIRDGQVNPGVSLPVPPGSPICEELEGEVPCRPGIPSSGYYEVPSYSSYSQSSSSSSSSNNAQSQVFVQNLGGCA